MGKKWYQGNESSEFHANLYPFDCFFCLYAFEYHAFVWNEKCIFQSGYNFFMGVSRTYVQIREYDGAVVTYFHCRRIDLCASDIQNAVKNISTFILIQ